MSRFFAARPDLVERLRRQVLVVGQQVAHVEQQAQQVGSSEQPGQDRSPGVVSARPDVSSELAGTVGSAGHTQHLAVDMDLTGVEPGVNENLEGRRNGSESAESVPSTLQNVQGFLSSLLGRVVGSSQADDQHDGAGIELPRNPGQFQPNANDVASTPNPSTLPKSPDVPIRRQQPLRKGRPDSYKI